MAWERNRPRDTPPAGPKARGHCQKGFINATAEIPEIWPILQFPYPETGRTDQHFTFPDSAETLLTVAAPICSRSARSIRRTAFQCSTCVRRPHRGRIAVQRGSSCADRSAVGRVPGRPGAASTCVPARRATSRSIRRTSPEGAPKRSGTATVTPPPAGRAKPARAASRRRRAPRGRRRR